jgi:hypothetical protein
MNAINKVQSPEELELEKKRQDLEQLRNELAESELEFHTLQAQLSAFESQYLNIVGRRIARNDELQARLAAAKSASKPDDVHIRQEAVEAQRLAQTSAEAFGSEPSTQNSKRFRPSDDCRKLYLQAAKAMHPDLATSDEDKSRRHRFMSALNEAYEMADEVQIRKILDDWNLSPEAVIGDGVGAELVRIIRQCSQLHKSINDIQSKIDALKCGDIHKLFLQALEVDPDTSIHLEMIATHLDVEFGELDRQFNALTNP